MNFNWFKNKTKQNNNQNVQEEPIDLTDVFVRSYTMLNDESRNKVAEVLKTIDFDNPSEIAKYIDDLFNKADIEKTCVEKAIKRYDHNCYNIHLNTINDHRTNRETFNDYHVTRLLNLETDIALNNISKIRNELEFGLLALDKYVDNDRDRKNEYPSRKYSELFIKSIGMIDRLTNKLNNDIKNNKFYKKYGKKAIVDYKEIANQDGVLDSTHFNCLVYTMYNLSERTLGYLSNDFASTIKEEIIDKMEGMKIRDDSIGEVNFLSTKKRTYINREMCDEAYDFAIHGDEGTSWRSFMLLVPTEFIDKLYDIIADYYHKREVYITTHKDDYKIYMDELDNIINGCNEKSIDELDKEKMAETTINYSRKLYRYYSIYSKERSGFFSESFDDYVDEEKMDELKKRFFIILVFNYLVNGEETTISAYRHSPWEIPIRSNDTEMEDIFAICIGLTHEYEELVLKASDMFYAKKHPRKKYYKK